MGAPVFQHRPFGTGTIIKMGRKYRAFGPGHGNQRGVPVGIFDTRYQAEKALEKWLAQNGRSA